MNSADGEIQRPGPKTGRARLNTHRWEPDT
jgi:hypothetical protein